MATETELHFDGWTVNRVSGEIARDGRASRLPQQPLRILLELADHAGAIVTREQLVKVLWPGGIVDFDNGLNVAVRKLRVALDDVGDTPRYIETLPKVGYRFIAKRGAAPAEVSPGPAAARPSRRRVALMLTVVALGLGVAGTWWWTMAGPDAAEQVAKPKHVPSVRAQELYLEGIHNRSRRDTNAFLLAVEKFEAAIREDPNYAQAWAALGAQLSADIVRQKTPPAQGLPRALEAARRALELDDNIDEGHALLGQIYLDHYRDFAAADREFKRALLINDRSARLWHHIAMWHAHQGQVEEALVAIRRARELEPMTLLFSSNYAMILVNARRYDEAIGFLKPIIEANPGFDQARAVLARALMATGDLAGAKLQLESRKDMGLQQSDLGVLYARLGDREAAMREVERLEARGREGFGVGYDLATIFAALGELDRGCEALTRAVDDHSILLVWMRLDPRMDPLRGRQCFTDVGKRIYPRK
jgi:DNA-binding winged helix-turn-helix (wHTH) protein/tetratricopeptide (TPR) repeat protein